MPDHPKASGHIVENFRDRLVDLYQRPRAVGIAAGDVMLNRLTRKMVGQRRAAAGLA